MKLQVSREQISSFKWLVSFYIQIFKQRMKSRDEGDRALQLTHSLSSRTSESGKSRALGSCCPQRWSRDTFPSQSPLPESTSCHTPSYLYYGEERLRGEGRLKLCTFIMTEPDGACDVKITSKYRLFSPIKGTHMLIRTPENSHAQLQQECRSIQFLNSTKDILYYH